MLRRTTPILFGCCLPAFGLVLVLVAGVLAYRTGQLDHQAAFGPGHAAPVYGVAARPRNWTVHFSPKGGCTESVVAALAQAKTSVHVLAYSFTSPGIAQALVDARGRGVKVEVVLDRSDETSKGSQAPFLERSKVPTRIDDKHAIAHNKTMVIDEAVVVTGSFNFTVSAEEHNAENCLIVHDADLAALYLADWHKHHDHARAPAP